MAELLDRRAFLASLVMASIGAAAQPTRRAGGKRIVVLGGGLAGLAAAWNLMNRGHDVRVFEAQHIPGGRVKTIREPFRNGGYAEAGALRIPNNHRYTMKYIKLMGLESKLVAYEQDGRQLWYLQGKRFATPQGKWPLEGLHPEEKTNPLAMLGRYWGPGFQAVGEQRPSRSWAQILAGSAARSDYRNRGHWPANGARDCRRIEACIGHYRRYARLGRGGQSAQHFAARDSGTCAWRQHEPDPSRQQRFAGWPDVSTPA